RAEKVMAALNRERQVLQLSEEIRPQAKSDADHQQRDYRLRPQMKAIQDELGGGEGGGAGIRELRDRAEKEEPPDHVRGTVEKELDKLARTNPAAPQYADTRNYIDWILNLRWVEYPEDHLDIKRAEEVLNEDHYGLEQVK